MITAPGLAVNVFHGDRFRHGTRRCRRSTPMNRSVPTTSRAVPAAVLSTVALLVAVLVAPPTAGATGRASEHASGHSSGRAMAHRHAHAMTASQVAFHDAMRKLWEDHITWTRLAIVTFADGSDGFSATAGRLLANQVDLGNAIKPFYGEQAGDRLTALLHDHITIAVELLQAAKSGDSAAFADARTRWYANADDIADHLSSLNPEAWPRAVLREMMRTHLDQTLTEAADELGGDFAGSVATYDAIHTHILAMADTLSAGIVAQFPRRFR
jgi:hypothetical protein